MLKRWGGLRAARGSARSRAARSARGRDVARLPPSRWHVSIKLLGMLSIRGARLHARAHPYRQGNLSPESVYYQSNYVNSFWTVSICLSKENQRKQCVSTKPGRHNNIVLRSYRYLWLRMKKKVLLYLQSFVGEKKTLNGNKNILK